MPVSLPRARDSEELPEEVYVSLVASLYSDPRTLIIGGLATLSAAFITAAQTRDPLFLACAATLSLITLIRAAEMRAFKRRPGRDLTAAAARHWELRYVVGSSAYVLGMGIWSFLALVLGAHPIVQLLCISVTLLNLVGVMGRNFGSKTLVTTQLLCAGIPLYAGLVWKGEPYSILMACVLAPFFFSFSAIADRLRRTLMGAVVAERGMRLMARQLDAALNNMSHGLCMLDRHGAIAISNERLPALLGLEAGTFGHGQSAFRTFLTAIRAGVAPADLRALVDELRLRMREAGSATLFLPVRGRRVLMVTSRRMPEGGLVLLAEDVTEQKDAEARISHMAHFDSLTDLPNRAMFRESITRMLKDVDDLDRCAILFVDLDEFKQVNDTLGHSTGDELLKLVAVRLRQIAPEARLVARLGGDEFVLVLRIGTADEAGTIAQRVVDTLGQDFDIDGHTVVIGASVGIAVAPGDGSDTATLLKNADMALYRAKAEGRRRYRFFEREMDARMRRRRTFEVDLRQAVADNALELHYQPMVNLRTCRILSCEALLRWNHPSLGYVPPSEFIPIAEELGLIIDIGRWALLAACREATLWPAETRISVNLSPVQFRQAGLVDAVREALASSGLDPARLQLEITESVLLRDTQATLEMLREIRTLGVSLALDDFGTGYSSLSYLRTFPLQTIKIDRSFLFGIEDNERQQILLRGISRLCGELGVGVVIEGVETTSQLRLISECPEIEAAQGYLFARPAADLHTRRLLAFGRAPEAVGLPGLVASGRSAA